MTELQKLKLLLGISDEGKDSLLTLLLEQADASFLDYTNREVIPTGATNIILELAVSRYNRIGSEALESTSYSNISENYLNDFSENEKKSLNRWRKVKML